MKALTLWRPYSCAIVRGPKGIENRGWLFSRAMLGETIAIHGGRKFSRDSAREIAASGLWPGVPLSSDASPEGVVGVARLAGAIDVNEDGDPFVVFGLPGVHVDVDAEWWSGDGPGWVLDQRRAIATPVPCAGALGLWRLPLAVEARVREQLGGAP